MKYISDNSLNDTINCLYRVIDTIFETFKHVEENISQELKDLLIKEREAFIEEQNKRDNLDY